MDTLRKYPRTPHLEGSRLQPGDEDLEQVRLRDLAGCVLTVEEKVDGANAGVSFSADGELRLQSRGHFLTGGARERQFALLKQWAAERRAALWERLSSRYVMFGEWMYAKHTIFYDALPSYFLEFDVYDRERDVYLSTERRHELLAACDVHAVTVLAQDRFSALPHLTALVGRARWKSATWRDRLRTQAEREGLDVERVVRQTDPSDEMEGLYVKHEIDGVVVGRYKWIRPSFLQAVVDSGSHWHSRPILPNVLA